MIVYSMIVYSTIVYSMMVYSMMVYSMMVCPWTKKWPDFQNWIILISRAVDLCVYDERSTRHGCIIRRNNTTTVILSEGDARKHVVLHFPEWRQNVIHERL